MIDSKYLDAIKRFEGFTPRAQWDYSQLSNGYGTRARYDGEVIDRAEADRRFKAEIKTAYDVVEHFAPHLDNGAKAALTSLTYNAGTSWTTAGLGNAVRSGDMDTAKAIFQQYTKAGGQSLPGLEQRRTAEATWFQNFDAGRTQPKDILATASAIEAQTAKIPEIEYTLSAASSHSVVAVAPAGYKRGQLSTSGFEPAAPDLKYAAALTLAEILSILSLSHIDQAGKQDSKDQSESDRRLAGSANSNSPVTT